MDFEAQLLLAVDTGGETSGKHNSVGNENAVLLTVCERT